MGSFLRYILLALALWFGTAGAVLAATCSPAQSAGSAVNSWASNCWLDFSSYNDPQVLGGGQTLNYVLSDGTNLSFTLTATTTTAGGLTALAAPSTATAAIGNTGYLGIPGRPILFTADILSNVILVMSNIVVTPPTGVLAPGAYQFVFADGESTQLRESLAFKTDGGNWVLLDQIKPAGGAPSPTIVNSGTSFTEAGVANALGAYLIGTTGPTRVTANILSSGIGKQGIMVGIRRATIAVGVSVAGSRARLTDQFVASVTSSPGGVLLTSASSSGTTSDVAQSGAASIAPGQATTVAEVIAAGSATALSGYTTRLTCINANPSSAVALPTNLLATSFTLPAIDFGDAVSCIFTNTAKPSAVAVQVITTGGIGGPYTFTQSNLSNAPPPITTTIANAASPLTGAPLAVALLNAPITLAISSTALNLTSASCTDANSAVTGNTGGFGSLSGTTLTIPAANVTAGAAISCIFTTAIGPPPVVALRITKSAPTPALMVGRPSTYVLTITNTGTVDATAANVWDALPSGLDFSSASGTNWSCTNTAADVRCAFSGSTIGASGGTSNVSIIVTPNSGTASSVTNYASVDPVGGAAPPAPGSSCAPIPACASNTAAVAPPPIPPSVSISKVADRQTADIGDVVSYAVDVRLVAGGGVPDLKIEDQLPRGFRYITNSARLMLNGVITAQTNDAALGLTTSNAGLRFSVGGLSPATTLRLSYRARIGVGAEQGDGINRALARFGAQISAEARVRVKIGTGVFWQQACLVGRVFVDENGNGLKDADEAGVPNVRLYLEDGTWFRTDEAGKYSYCGLEPITHVIALDRATLPPGSLLRTTGNRNARDPGSLFLDVKRGELARADFAVQQAAKPGLSK